MSYTAGDELGLRLIKTELVRVLENAGFTAVEEYTDFDSRSADGCIAVWGLESVKLTEAGRRANTAYEAVSGELVFNVRLYGKLDSYGSREVFDGMCADACGRTSELRTYGIVSTELGALQRDAQQRRLLRKMKVGYRICLKRISQ